MANDPTLCEPWYMLAKLVRVSERLDPWMIGVILSAMVYGGVLSLTLPYIPLLLKTSYNITRRMRICLLLYVIFMVAISTVYIITVIIALNNAMPYADLEINDAVNLECSEFPISEFWFQTGVAGGPCIMLASWGSGGFMLWRCAMLYEGISRPRRIALFSVLGLLALISFGSGLALLIDIKGFDFFLVIAVVTIFFHLVTSTLITFRFLYLDGYTQKTVGLERRSPFMTIIIICIETSALIVVFGLIYLILLFKMSSASVIPLQLLVHVYVIPPLVIVHRIARGRTAITGQRPPSSENGPVVSALRFEPQPQPISLNRHEA